MSDKQMLLGGLETVHIDRVRPYWRNPRRVSEDTVNKLVESIKMYGYQQPIVVDENYVIIVGHTRYAAFRRMKVEQIPVKVETSLSEQKVKEYRLIDNKAGEFSSWDFDALIDELAEVDETLMKSFFPEIGGTERETQTLREETALEEHWDKVNTHVEFICPTCFHQWETDVKRGSIMAGIIRAGEAQ